MGEWSNLNASQKAQVIKWAIANGVSDINTIRDTYNIYAGGGKIEIKHPGRLTALKERTGKTEAELWATGNTATRKMITFARNARKWHKGADGLYLDTEANTNQEFLPSDSIVNRQYWLYQTKGGEKTKYKSRPGVVNLQNIQDTLDSFGGDIQYVWDTPEKETYSAFHRNPEYRPTIIPADVPTTNLAIPVNSPVLPKISINIPKLTINPSFTEKFKPKLQFTKTITNGNWIPVGGENNGVHGYTSYHMKNSPYYKIEYQSAPGSASSGEGSQIVTDSVAAGIPIQELNERIFNYKTKLGGRFADNFSTGGPLYPFSFQKNPFLKTPDVRF